MATLITDDGDIVHAITTNAGVRSHVGVVQDTIVVLKTFDEGRNDLAVADGDAFDLSSIREFILTSRLSYLPLTHYISHFPTPLLSHLLSHHLSTFNKSFSTLFIPFFRTSTVTSYDPCCCCCWCCCCPALLWFNRSPIQTPNELCKRALSRSISWCFLTLWRRIIQLYWRRFDPWPKRCGVR